MKKEKVNKTDKRDTKFKVFITIVTVLNLVVAVCFGLAYGNLFGFRDWFVSTAMTTGTHRYFAYTLYDTNTISTVTASNAFAESDASTDITDITVGGNTYKSEYKDIYEQQVLDREEGTPYKIVKLTMDADGVDGYIAFIYDSTKVDLCLSNKFKSNYGQTIPDMCTSNNAYLAINGGGHLYGSNDTEYFAGDVIKDGKLVNKGTFTVISNGGGLIGFTKSGVLMLTKSKGQAAINEGMYNGVEFGPFLIVNGESVIKSNSSSGGTHPRTCIAQRQDGIVIFLVVDGRTQENSGADYNQLVTILQRYDAYNAANLDGGGSSTLVENGTVLNTPFGTGFSVDVRYVMTGFILKK